jgi:preprotein translocase subunit SecG
LSGESRPAATGRAGGWNVMSRFRFVFVVFYFTGILILAVYLRSLNNRIFYELSLETDEQERLNEELGDKQLRLERLINPTAVSERLEE